MMGRGMRKVWSRGGGEGRSRGGGGGWGRDVEGEEGKGVRWGGCGGWGWVRKVMSIEETRKGVGGRKRGGEEDGEKVLKGRRWRGRGGGGGGEGRGWRMGRVSEKTLIGDQAKSQQYGHSVSPKQHRAWDSRESAAIL
ncbi:hypothetical protein LSAT2_009019 [Lamellibrachia satsuma]|nr:hypothetical protein LSAT2_009019 [Lamellibrachia satsuma]